MDAAAGVAGCEYPTVDIEDITPVRVEPSTRRFNSIQHTANAPTLQIILVFYISRERHRLDCRQLSRRSCG